MKRFEEIIKLIQGNSWGLIIQHVTEFQRCERA